MSELKNTKKPVDKNSLKYVSLVLLAICAVAGLFLGLADSVTKKPIAAKKEAVNQAAFEKVLPGATDLKAVDIPESYSDIDQAYVCADGYVIRVIGKGYAGDDIVIALGIDNNDTITGLRIVSHSETPGLGASATEEFFYSQFEGMSAIDAVTVNKQGNGTGNEVDALTGATKTTNGVANAVNRALEFYQKVLKEGK